MLTVTANMLFTHKSTMKKRIEICEQKIIEAIPLLGKAK